MMRSVRLHVSTDFEDDVFRPKEKSFSDLLGEIVNLGEGPEGANEHESNDDNGRHISAGTSATPRGPISRDPVDWAEDWHGEDHVNQGTDAHEGETKEELLDESDD